MTLFRNVFIFIYIIGTTNCFADISLKDYNDYEKYKESMLKDCIEKTKRNTYCECQVACVAERIEFAKSNKNFNTREPMENLMEIIKYFGEEINNFCNSENGKTFTKGDKIISNIKNNSLQFNIKK